MTKDMITAKEIVTAEAKGNSKFGKCYFNTNEYISEYMSHFRFDAPVLTVAASADQAFYSIINGARDIDAFDINKLSYYVMMLKIGAIEGLSRNDFLEYFPIDNTSKNTYFSKKSYDKFSCLLKDDVKLFWDYLYQNTTLEQDYLKLSRPSSTIRQSNNSYYSDTNYDKLKEGLKVSNIKFYNCDLFSMDREIRLNRNMYGTILLSNIYDHSPIPELSYSRFVIRDIVPLLSENGTCLAYYSFNPNSMKLKKDFINKKIYVGKESVASIRLVKKPIK